MQNKGGVYRRDIGDKNGDSRGQNQQMVVARGYGCGENKVEGRISKPVIAKKNINDKRIKESRKGIKAPSERQIRMKGSSHTGKP